MTKQPTLAQIEKASKAHKKAYSTFQAIEFTNPTQKQYDNAKAREEIAHCKYWELVESVTEANPEYNEIIDNGHYDA
jgi:hypothetical protein